MEPKVGIKTKIQCVFLIVLIGLTLLVGGLHDKSLASVAETISNYESALVAYDENTSPANVIAFQDPCACSCGCGGPVGGG